MWAPSSATTCLSRREPEPGRESPHQERPSSGQRSPSDGLNVEGGENICCCWGSSAERTWAVCLLLLHGTSVAFHPSCPHLDSDHPQGKSTTYVFPGRDGSFVAKASGHVLPAREGAPSVIPYTDGFSIFRSRARGSAGSFLPSLSNGHRPAFLLPLPGERAVALLSPSDMEDGLASLLHPPVRAQAPLFSPRAWASSPRCGAGSSCYSCDGEPPLFIMR